MNILTYRKLRYISLPFQPKKISVKLLDDFYGRAKIRTITIGQTLCSKDLDFRFAV